jgi:hypothetical protein
MNHFKLNLVPGKSHVKSLKDLKGKYWNLRANELNQQVNEIIQLHDLRSFELVECRLSLSTLSRSLSSISQLRNLKIRGLKIVPEELESQIEPIQFNHLQNLTIIQCKMEILQLIATTSLTSLHIHSTELSQFSHEKILFTPSADLHHAVKLILLQSRLKQLSLTGDVVAYFLLQENLTNQPFRLDSVELLKSCIRQLDTQLTSFLDFHKTTLKKLRIESPISCNAQLFILQSLLNLQDLEVSLNISKDEIELFSALEPLPEIRSFRDLNNARKSNFDFEKLNQLFPKMESLTMWNDVSKTRLRSNLFSKLRVIRVDFIGSKLCNAEFSGLKELHLAKCDGNYFHDFMTKHSANLEVLNIGWAEEASFAFNDTISYINRCSNLKAISFISGSPFIVRMFKKIKRGFPWTLESKFKAGDEEVKVIFRFPDDQALFEENCSTWDDQLIRDFSSFENYGLNAFVNKFK